MTEAAGKTALGVRCSPLNASQAEMQAFAAAHANMTQGWGGTLEKLAEFLAKA